MTYATSQVKTTTTEVRTAVATFASKPATPNLARIAVRAAKNADNSAQVNQVISFQYAWKRARRNEQTDVPPGAKSRNHISIASGPQNALQRHGASSSRGRCRYTTGVTLNADATDFLRMW